MADYVSKRIKRRRQELNITLQDLETRTGISRSTLQRIETQGADKVGIDKIQTIADALEVSPTYLMGWESNGFSYHDMESIQSIIDTLGITIKYDPESEMFDFKYGDYRFSLDDDELHMLKHDILEYCEYQFKRLIEKKVY